MTSMIVILSQPLESGELLLDQKLLDALRLQELILGVFWVHNFDVICPEVRLILSGGLSLWVGLGLEWEAWEVWLEFPHQAGFVVAKALKEAKANFTCSSLAASSASAAIYSFTVSSPLKLEFLLQSLLHQNSLSLVMSLLVSFGILMSSFSLVRRHWHCAPIS